jgi:hypothetical protein
LTKDCDILHPETPNEIAEASRGFAIEIRAKGGTLQDNWLNNGPSSLASHLLPRREERLQTVFAGTAIHLRCLGREDLLCAKLFALCDRGIDLGDCLALAPNRRMCFHGWSDRMLTLTGQIMFARRLPIFGGGSVMAFSRAFAPSPLVRDTRSLGQC